MARATTLFVATDDELVQLFSAVRHSLDQPITTVKRNPVMRQVLGTASWDPGIADEAAAISARGGQIQPETPSIYAAGGKDPIPPIVPADAAALEETAPLRLRALPHAAVAGVTGLELEALVVVLLGDRKPPARIVEPNEDDGFVDGLPTEALAPLAALTEEAVTEITARWNVALRITRRKAEESSLLALRALAREAIARGGNVFTHMP